MSVNKTLVTNSKTFLSTAPCAMKCSTAIGVLFSTLALADGAELNKRQGCPKVYTFGARETTVSQGYGSAGALVKQIQSAFPGSGAEAIVYPACGGQASCGGISYDNSATKGTAAVVKS